MSASSLLQVSALLLLVGVALAADVTYELQRRYDTTAQWQTVLPFTVDTASLRVRPSSSKAQQTLSKGDVAALADASMLFYRVMPKVAAAAEAPQPAAAAVTTACSLIRSFEASKSQLTLPEVVNVVLAVDGTVTGLQLSSKAGGTCDKSVLNLFPSVLVSTTVGAFKAGEPKNAQNVVADAAHWIHPSGYPLGTDDHNKRKGNAGGGEGRGRVDGNGDEGPKEDNRSFFEKYQMYIFMFIAYMVVNAFIQTPKKDGAGGGGEK